MEKQYATLKDVAELAGTTAATVSYVLNGSGKRYISQDMRKRVERAADQLNYVRSSAASSLKGKTAKVIALLVPQYSNQFFTKISLGVEKIADRYGYIVTMCNTYDDPKRELDILKRMQAQRVDGYIIAPGVDGGKNTEQIRKMGIPLVTVARTLNISEPYFGIGMAEYETSCRAIEHLIAQGHRKIGYVAWDVSFGSMELRLKAYQDTLKKYGIREEFISVGEFNAQSGWDHTKELLERYPEITAVFFPFNSLARGGVNYIASRNMKIGKDISVVILGAPDWVQTGYNRITCFDLKGFEIGERAAAMLMKIIENRGGQEPHIEIQDAEFIEGSSVCRLDP